MRSVLLLLLACAGAALPSAHAATPSGGQTASATSTNPPLAAPPFAFIAIGCMPYTRLPGSEAAFHRVLAEINRHSPAFAIHLGDILGGEELCTDELLQKRLDEFNSVETAMLYTPGDNEWTDTHRTVKFHPLNRLARIRQLFFAAEQSLGQRPIPLTTQRRSPSHAKFVENARWTHGGVVFATVHVVGSGNNHQTNVVGALEEWRERDEANLAWLRETFREAKALHAPGVALFCQANPIRGHPGFTRFLEALESETLDSGKPVLLVHADEHRFRLEPGFRCQVNGPPIPNLTRLETFGESDLHGVLVTVDPTSASVFLPGPLIVPGNRLPRLPRLPPPAAPAR